MTLEERNEGREIGTDEMIAGLLADLQQEQDKEIEVVLMSLSNMVGNRQTDLQTDRPTDRQTDKPAGRQTDRNRQTRQDRQTTEIIIW